MKKNNNLYIIILITFLLLLKIFISYKVNGHDTVFHLSNIINLSKTISITNLLGNNITKYSFNKFGYGLWIFYPKLPHLLGAYLYLITNNVFLSVNIIYFLVTVLSGIFTYFLILELYNSKKSALMGSIIYLCIPYHLTEMYIRDAYAENFMFMVFPLILLGLVYLKKNNYRRFYLCFILGYLIGLNSHLALMLYFTCFLFIYLLSQHKTYLNKDKLYKLIIATFTVTSLFVPRLIILLEHKNLNIYRVFTHNFSDKYTVMFNRMFFKDFFIYNDNFTKLSLYFSKISIIILLLSIIMIIKNKEKIMCKYLLMFLLVFTFITSFEIWNYMPEILISIQFPWRLLTILSLLFSIIASYFFKTIKISKFSLSIIIILLLLSTIPSMKFYTDDKINIDEVVNNRISMGYQNEYTPFINNKKETDCYMKYRKNYFECREYKIIANKEIDINIEKDSFPELLFSVDNIENEVTIELPRIYYLGYELYYDNNKIPLNLSSDGFLEANIKNNGKYKLIYRGTIMYNISRWYRLLFIIFILIKGVLNERKNCSGINTML